MLSRLTTPILVVLIGVAALVFGLVRSDEPVCGEGAEFGPGKVCQIVQKGQTIRKTYEEMQAERQRVNFWIPVAGVAIIIAGLGYGALMMTRSPKQPSRPARPNRPQSTVPPVPPLHQAKPVNVPRSGSSTSSPVSGRPRTMSGSSGSSAGTPAIASAPPPPTSQAMVPPRPPAPQARGSAVPRPGEQPPQYWPSRGSASTASGQSAPSRPAPPQQYGPGQGFGQPQAEPARTGSWQHKPPPTPQAPGPTPTPGGHGPGPGRPWPNAGAASAPGNPQFDQAQFDRPQFDSAQFDVTKPPPAMDGPGGRSRGPTPDPASHSSGPARAQWPSHPPAQPDPRQGSGPHGADRQQNPVAAPRGWPGQPFPESEATPPRR